MKICPNCGAENNHDTLTCILCEFEFDIEERLSDGYENDAFDENRNSASNNVSSNTNDSVNPENTYNSDSGNTVSSNGNSKAIIIALVSIIVIAGGVIGGIFLMKDKDTSKSGSSDVKNSKTSNGNITYENQGEITTTLPVAESASISAVTTECVTPITSPKYTSDEISTMFSAYISKNPDPNRTYDSSDYGYALIDINNDGIEELLITHDEVEEGSPGILGIFNISNQKLDCIWMSDFRTLGKLCDDNYICGSYIYGQGHGITIYKYSLNCEFELIESLDYDGSDHSTTGKYKIIHNNNSTITEEEADSIIKKYKAIKFKANELTISVPKSESTTTAQSEFKETYAFYGVVSTESDTLNLRDKPSTDSKVITELPKGTKGSVYYIDGYSDWYKIYTDGGQSGYVSAQYIKEYNESSNNNDTPYVSGMQTPFGTFTYSNFKESDYNSYTIYDSASVGIYLNCDIEAFNEKHSNYRIDNVYFRTVKDSINRDKPHDYKMRFVLTGTVLRESISCFNPTLYLRNEKTGNEELVYFLEVRTTLYKGETFCFDSRSSVDISDNTTYTLILK